MFDHVVDGKAVFMNFRDEVIGHLAQAALAVATIRGFVGPRRHECAHTSARFNDATAFQLRVDLGDGVRIDAQIDRELPHSRQLVAYAELAGRDCEPNRALKLVIEWRRMLCVYLEHRFAPLYYDNGTSKVLGNRASGGGGLDVQEGIEANQQESVREFAIMQVARFKIGEDCAQRAAGNCRGLIGPDH